MTRLTVKEAQSKYSVSLPYYKKYEKAALSLINKFRSENKSIQIFDPIVSRIKTEESIVNNIMAGKYDKADSRGNTISSFENIKDVLGLRITCHCGTDLEQIVTALGGFLLRNSTRKGITKLPTEDHRNRPSDVGKEDAFDPYQGVHFYIKKSYPVGDLICEIQARTVLGNAWAIQSHKYMYKTEALPGDIVTLGSAISKIYIGIEDIWDIIKRNHEENIK